MSWHHGWLLHDAPAQPPGSPTRMALAVSYFRDGARVVQQQCGGRRGGPRELPRLAGQRAREAGARRTTPDMHCCPWWTADRGLLEQADESGSDLCVLHASGPLAQAVATFQA